MPDTACPRCGARFHCGIDDAEPCACCAVVLPAATLARLQDRYSGCLCLDCLRALQLAPSGDDSRGK